MSDKSSLQDLMHHLHDASQAISSVKDAAQVGQALMGFASQAGVDAARLLLFPEVSHTEDQAPPPQDGEELPVGDRSPGGSGLTLSDGVHPRDASATTYIEVREGWTVDDRPAQPYGTRLSLEDYPLLAFMHATQPVVCEDVTTDPRANEPTRQLMAISGLASFLIVPLTVGDRWLGAFFLGRNAPSTYADDLIYASWTLAGQAAAALESLRLLAEVERERQRYWDLYTAQKQVEEALRKANRELDCLNDIGRKINESPPIPEFLGWVTERIPPAMQHPDVCVAAIEFEGQLYGAAEAVELPRQIVQGLRVHGELAGYVYISYREERDFLDAESMLLGDIVRRVSGYIESRRVFEEARTRAKELAVLNELSQALTTRLNLEEVLEEIYRGASRLLDVTNFYVGLYDAEKEEITFLFNVTESAKDAQITVISADEGLAGYIIRNHTSLLLEDNVRARHEALGIEMVGEEPLSWLGVPLIVGDRVLGVIAAQSFATPRLYNEHHRGLLIAIASQAAIAIQNARLFEQTQARARREQTLREITTHVHGLTDPDAIVRTAVRELGTALGRSTFVRLGGSPQGEELRLTLSDGPHPRDASATPVVQKGGDDGSDMAPQAHRSSPKGALRAGKGGE